MNFYGKEKFSSATMSIKNFFADNFYFMSFLLSSFLVYLIWLVGFFPGNMSYDSVYQWSQTISRHYDNAHPFLHTLYIQLFRIIWNTPAAVSVFQIFLTSVSIAYFLQFLINKGISKKHCFTIFFIFVSLPSIGIYNITLWKDVLFSQLLFILMIIWVVHFIKSKNGTIKTWEIIGVSLLVGGISLLRLNAVIYLVVVPILYYSLRLVDFKRFLLMFASVFAFFLIINVGLANYLNVNNERLSFYKELEKIQILSLILKMDYQLNSEEKAIIEKVDTIDNFKSRYNCSAVDYLYLSNNNFTSKPFLSAEFVRKFDSVVNNILLKNIPLIMADRACLFSHLIGFGEDKWSYLYTNQIITNSFGLTQNPNKKLNLLLNNYLEWSKKYPQRFFYWSHVFYILVFAYYMLKSINDKNSMLLGAVLLIGINIPVIFLTGVARDFRYLYMIQITFLFLFLIDKLKYKKQYD